MRTPAVVILAAVLAAAGCSSDKSSSSAPAAAPSQSLPAATTGTPDAPAACTMTSSGDIIERRVTPLGPATAEQLGSVDLVNCVATMSELAKETSTDPGYCTTAAWAADNPGYNPDAVPAPPLKKIQAQAGMGC